MPNTITIVIGRLSECEGNVSERIGSHGNLTDLGRRQAEATRDRVAGIGVAAWFALENSACRETAEIIAKNGVIWVMREFNDAPFQYGRGRP